MRINPRSLYDLLDSDPTEQDCIDYLEEIIWNGKPVSPHDTTSKVYKSKSRKNWYKCKNTNKYFNVRTTTIFFKNRKISLKKLFWIIAAFSSRKKGISSYQLACEIGITQKSAWNLLNDLRDTLKQSNFIKDMLKGSVEGDEVYLGGSNSNRHWDKKVPNSQGRSCKDKIPVLVLIERGGNAIIKVVPNVKRRTLEPIIIKHVEKGSNVYTDEWKSYNNLGEWFNHQIVNHKRKQYVKGKVSVNSAESFNAYLKRGIQGTYHHISRKYSQKYMDEFAFRFNTRKYKEQDRFNLALSLAVGKSLSYRELVGVN